MMPRQKRIPLDSESWLTLVQPFTREEATQVMQRLLDETKLEERSIFLFGRSVVQPRLIGWAGELPYTYSRQTLQPRPVGPVARDLLELTNRECSHGFNHLLFNLYRDERDSMGMHSDDEPELGPFPRIASWSFGEVRRFLVKSKKRGGPQLTLDLEHGTLLVMDGATQRDYVHGVPKERTVRGPRLNVNCRLVTSPR